MSDLSTLNGRRTLPKASDILADDLRAHILGENLQPGTPLPSERELVQSQQLSRATVREALRLLEAEGLITIRRGPRGGISVRHPDPLNVSRGLATIVAVTQAPLRELFIVRKLIEPAAAAGAAAAATPEQRAQLSETAHRTESSERVEFHLLVAELSGNALFYVILAAFHDVLERHVQREEITGEDIGQTQAAHEKIAAAIIAGDSGRAERAMRRHIELFEARMQELGRLDDPIIPRSAWERDADRRAPSAFGFH